MALDRWRSRREPLWILALSRMWAMPPRLTRYGPFREARRGKLGSLADDTGNAPARREARTNRTMRGRQNSSQPVTSNSSWNSHSGNRSYVSAGAAPDRRRCSRWPESDSVNALLAYGRFRAIGQAPVLERLRSPDRTSVGTISRTQAHLRPRRLPVRGEVREPASGPGSARSAGREHAFSTFADAVPRLARGPTTRTVAGDDGPERVRGACAIRDRAENTRSTMLAWATRTWVGPLPGPAVRGS